MLYTPSYQMYKYEHGLPVSAADQRAADVRAGEIAAGLHELLLSLRHALRRRNIRTADPATAPARFMSSVR